MSTPVIPRNVWVAIPQENSLEFRVRAIQTLGLYSWHDWSEEGALPMQRNLYGVDSGKLGDRFHLVWNEPEMENQDNLSARAAAELTKSWPPSYAAMVALPNTLLLNRSYSWVELYLLLGGMVPQTWAIHIYANDGEQLRYLWQEWINFLHGHKLPQATILSEVAGVGADYDSQADVLRGVFDLLKTNANLVAAYWMSVFYAGNMDSNLLDAAGNLTELGKTYIILRGETGAAATGGSVYLPLIHTV